MCGVFFFYYLLQVVRGLRPEWFLVILYFFRFYDIDLRRQTGESNYTYRYKYVFISMMSSFFVSIILVPGLPTRLQILVYLNENSKDWYWIRHSISVAKTIIAERIFVCVWERPETDFGTITISLFVYFRRIVLIPFKTKLKNIMIYVRQQFYFVHWEPIVYLFKFFFIKVAYKINSTELKLWKCIVLRGVTNK